MHNYFREQIISVFWSTKQLLSFLELNVLISSNYWTQKSFIKLKKIYFIYQNLNSMLILYSLRNFLLKFGYFKSNCSSCSSVQMFIFTQALGDTSNRTAKTFWGKMIIQFTINDPRGLRLKNIFKLLVLRSVVNNTLTLVIFILNIEL